MRRAGLPARWPQALGAVLLAVVLLPALRRAVESSMTAHMLLQYALLMLAGGLLAARVPARWRAPLARWNALGIAGLLGAAIVLAFAMVPRLLDLALVDARVEAAKLSALLLAGAALRLSWRPAGIVVQAFFLGNVLPMTGVAGMLYQDAPLRLCNAYRLDDQQSLGLGLVGLAVGVCAAWLAALACGVGGAAAGAALGDGVSA